MKLSDVKDLIDDYFNDKSSEYIYNLYIKEQEKNQLPKNIESEKSEILKTS